MPTQSVHGPFEVRLIPQPASDEASRAGVSRMSLDKRFQGALEAVSQGEMLAFRSGVEGSAGYVAMETVRGSLEGRSGLFVLQHSSTLQRGSPRQSITVVPDSGTEQLAGLSGSMTVDIGADGSHAYTFDYSLP